MDRENDYKIDILKVLNIIYYNKKSILLVSGICFLLGFIIAFTSRNEYTVIIKAVTTSSSAKSGFSSLLPSALSSIGANLSILDNSDILSTNVYPDILSSKTFKINILNSKIRFEKPDTILPLSVYLEKYKPFSLPSAIYSSVKRFPGIFTQVFIGDNKRNLPTIPNDTNILSFDKVTEDLFYELDSRIKIKIDQFNSNLIILTIKLPDKRGVAELGNLVVIKLNDAIINYKIQKAKSDAIFIEKRYNEAYAKFIKAQMNLSKFRDENRSMISASAKAVEERLQMEFNIAYNVCNSLALQLEQAQIKIQENKPVLQVIEPPYIPNYKSGPKRILIVLLLTVIGFTLASIFTIYKNYNSRIH